MFKLSRASIPTAMLGLLLVCGQNLFPLTESAESFDTPLKKSVVDFGPAPDSLDRGFRVKLSCYFYEGFMVKEYDEGQKGAEWLAIAPFEQNAAPQCTQSHTRNETVIKYPEWSGYFKGTRANWVFFNAADGENGGLQFVVYDARKGKKVFEDSAYDSTMWSEKVEDSPFNRLRIEKSQDGQLSLKYLRVVEAECDLHSEKSACWEAVRKRLGLKNAQVPVCSGYKDIQTRWTSSIAYPVEVFLIPRPAVKTVPGPTKCWPVD